MFRNKKKTSVITLLVLTMLLSGCSFSQSLVTDTGSGSKESIDKAEYLNTEALKQYNQNEDSTQYKVHTLEKGNFTEAVLNQTMDWVAVNIPTVRVTVENATVRFGEYQVRMFERVEEGDTLATVRSEADEIEIEQARLTLQRLKERYEEAKVQKEETLKEILENRSMIYNDYERAVADIQYKQSELDFEMEARDYEYKIAQAEKELNKLFHNQTQQEIKASIAGYVFFETKQASGKELENGDYICTIVNIDDFYLLTDKQNDLFGYGMTFGFSNGVDNPIGTVVSGGSKMLYGNLDKGLTYFQASYEGETTLEERIRGNSLKITGNAREVQNVILVPKSAVTEEESGYFVTVLKEDGSLMKTEFLPGGSNSDCYWVLKGLEEGTKVILDGSF